MNKKLKLILAIGLFVVLAQSVSGAEDKPKEPAKEVDDRISLGFTAAEKVVFLEEMRQMLVSIQGIMAGIGAEDRELIIKSARYSGNRMARETPESIKNKTLFATMRKSYFNFI